MSPVALSRIGWGLPHEFLPSERISLGCSHVFPPSRDRRINISTLPWSASLFSLPSINTNNVPSLAAKMAGILNVLYPKSPFLKRTVSMPSFDVSAKDECAMDSDKNNSTNVKIEFLKFIAAI